MSFGSFRSQRHVCKFRGVRVRFLELFPAYKPRSCQSVDRNHFRSPQMYCVGRINLPIREREALKQLKYKAPTCHNGFETNPCDARNFVPGSCAHCKPDATSSELTSKSADTYKSLTCFEHLEKQEIQNKKKCIRR